MFNNNSWDIVFATLIDHGIIVRKVAVRIFRAALGILGFHTSIRQTELGQLSNYLLA